MRLLQARGYELFSQQQHKWTSRTYEIILIHACAVAGRACMTIGYFLKAKSLEPFLMQCALREKLFSWMHQPNRFQWQATVIVLVLLAVSQLVGTVVRTTVSYRQM